MVHFPSFNNEPVDVTIYGHTFKFRNFTDLSGCKSLKELEEHGITPYHFLVHKDYYNNIYTIENNDYYPYQKYLNINIILELFEFFKDIIPKNRLLLYLFYLDGKKIDFPLFDPEIIGIQYIPHLNLDIVKKYKKLDKDDINYILNKHNCNKDICEYLENTFQITNIPTKKNEANTFIGCFIKAKYIPGIQTLSNKFKIDTT